MNQFSEILVTPIADIHLIHCKVNASIRYDAQQVWYVALVECSRSLLLENVFGTVDNTRVLTSLAQR